MPRGTSVLERKVLPMKKLLVSLLLVLMAIAVALNAVAVELDLSQYSDEEID